MLGDSLVDDPNALHDRGNVILGGAGSNGEAGGIEGRLRQVVRQCEAPLFFVIPQRQPSVVATLIADADGAHMPAALASAFRQRHLNVQRARVARGIRTIDVGIRPTVGGRRPMNEVLIPYKVDARARNAGAFLDEADPHRDGVARGVGLIPADNLNGGDLGSDRILGGVRIGGTAGKDKGNGRNGQKNRHQPPGQSRGHRSSLERIADARRSKTRRHHPAS